MEVEFGVLNIYGSRSSGGPILNKFTKPPVISCQLVRSNQYAWDAGPLHIYIFNVTNNSFQYIVRGEYKPGDQIHWIAVGN